MIQDSSNDFDGAFDGFAKARPALASADPVELNSDVPASEPAAAAEPAQPAQQPANTASADVSEGAVLKRQLADMAHRERSSANRISTFARQNTELQSQVQAMQAQLLALSQPRANAPGAQDTDEPDVLDGADDLRGAVERRVERATSQLRQQLDAAVTRVGAAEAAAMQAARSVEPLMQERAQADINSVTNQLNTDFGGWDKLMPTPAFQDWITSKPDAIQSLYRQGNTFGDTSVVLRLYAAETGHQFKAAGQPAADTRQPQASDSLRMAAGIRPRSAGAGVRPNSDDFEGAFAEFAGKKATRS